MKAGGKDHCTDAITYRELCKFRSVQRVCIRRFVGIINEEWDGWIWSIIKGCREYTDVNTMKSMLSPNKIRVAKIKMLDETKVMPMIPQNISASSNSFNISRCRSFIMARFFTHNLFKIFFCIILLILVIIINVWSQDDKIKVSKFSLTHNRLQQWNTISSQQAACG